MSYLDKDIEDFWLTFKCCIVNFYKICGKYIDVETTSNILNTLQKTNQYHKIEFIIQQQINNIAQDLFKYITLINNDNSLYLYHARIIITNIKRWEKLREKKMFFKKELANENYTYLMIAVFKSCMNSLEKRKNTYEIIDFFLDAGYIIMYKKNNRILDFSLKIELPHIIVILKEYIDVVKMVNNEYDLNLPDNISGIKIYKKINQRK